MAFAVLALFTGLASAQVIPGSQQLTCATNVGVTPALRGEGWTEMTGDITITCTGGIVPTLSTATVPSPVGLVNFTIFYNSTVTSRLFSADTRVSEALLLIDEPGSGLLGAGPQRPQTLCTTPLSGCTAIVSDAAATFAAGGAAFATTDGTTAAPNVYQGIVSGNSVTFLGVPVLAPTTTGSRVFRITNVRINAVQGATQVQASISTTPASALAITQPVTIVGYVSPSLTATASTGVSFQQCVSQTRQLASTLSFKENFASAFKTRVFAQTDTPYSGQTGLVLNPDAGHATSQSTPGSVVNSNSESNFVFPVGGSYAGLADYGTRLKATFNNVPSGARIFVSTTNTGAPTLVNPGGNVGNAISANYVGLAKLVTSEIVSDGAAGFSGVPPSLDTSATVTSTVGNVTISEVLYANGVGSAVWEVLNTNPNISESFSFGVYVTFVSNVSQNFPPPGSPLISVNLSYAPTAGSGLATTGVVPRFTADSTARPIVTIGICRTVLLYPFVTNQAGFDTGISIANTTEDPFGTGGQAGVCKLNWYGGTTAAPDTSPAASDTPIVPRGKVFANTVSSITMAPTFQGYMIAVCNFQYAHGFAAITSNYGANNGIFTTYLAVVLTDGRSNTNTTSAENGGN